MRKTISMVLALASWLINGPTVVQEELTAVFSTVPCHHDLTCRGETSQDIISLNSTLIMVSRVIRDIIIRSNKPHRLILNLVSSD